MKMHQKVIDKLVDQTLKEVALRKALIKISTTGLRARLQNAK